MSSKDVKPRRLVFTGASKECVDRVALVAAHPSYTRMYHYYPYCYYPRYPGGFYVKPEDGNIYTTLEPTLSSNPNVFFQRGGVHPGMMY